MTRYYAETPCEECGRFHQEPLLREGGDPESSIAYCYVGGSRVSLANGERVEPDYEAAARAIATVDDGSPLDELPGSLRRIYQEMARVAVDAAIGDKLLVDPPSEGD